MEANPGDVSGRRAAMAVLAQAPADEIAAGLAALGPTPHAEVRPAETGLVMVRGRIGGDGAPFNLGEATVTRCAVQLTSGEIGFGYVLGRDRGKARLAALCDALWQSAQHRTAIERNVLAPLRARQHARLARSREETAATKVDFFTLVRGDNA
ncbi:MAG TPA: phosphonate C-P lyase system protein PhnG [Xanthobacteraceae bacterium]|jgi:alpha-D-ribose 1-methylphosphonate 5-triphosphate synthase subunit PhnG|nr:phosphonate C-P lyase system protein PhnG [Xanthobacteraceae bacterium]